MDQILSQPETPEQATKRAWSTPRLHTEGRVAEVTQAVPSGPQ
jgi:hypothetical protein